MHSLESNMDLINVNCLSLKDLGSNTALLLFPLRIPSMKLSSFTIFSSNTGNELECGAVD
jgi:hypothetical protein